MMSDVPDGIRIGGPLKLPDTNEDWWEDDEDDADDDLEYYQYSENDTREYE